MKKLYAIDSSGFVRRRREKKLKRRKKHKASILQEKGSPCYLCMKMRPHYEWKRAVHEHHIFGGSNRDKSEAEGLKVYLCLEHHISGKEAVHNNAEMIKVLRQDGQRAFEKTHTREEFMKLFGKNYLEETGG